MGNDGGSIPKRRELVKESARQPTAAEQKATALEALAHAWSVCPLTSEALDAQNTVSDSRGRLYNYESVLQCLMPSPDTPVPETTTATFEKTGITALKDVVKLKFTLRKGKDENGKEVEVRACPISQKELGSSTKAVYIVPCGHVLADVAMREMPETDRNCPVCSEAFLDRDVIPILSIEQADLDKLAKRMEELKTQGLTHSLKKDKSASKKKRKAEDLNGEKTNGKEGKEAKKNGIENRINNAMTASLTAKVLAEQEESTKRRKMAMKQAELVR